jgi:hypothetical protein
MWEPRRLTNLWAFTACYRDSFTFLTVATSETTLSQLSEYILIILGNGKELRGCCVFRTVLAFNWRKLFIVVLSSMETACVVESYVLWRSLDCFISLATGYGMNDRKIRSLIQAQLNRFLSSPQRPDRFWIPPKFIQNASGAHSSGLMPQERETDNSPLI